jgi:hypothetical protein
VVAAASLAVATIGHALAQARGLVTEHAVKRVDRLLSNDGIDVRDGFTHWAPHQIGARRRTLVAMAGPSSTKTTRRRLCWAWLPATAGRRRRCG